MCYSNIFVFFENSLAKARNIVCVHFCLYNFWLSCVTITLLNANSIKICYLTLLPCCFCYYRYTIFYLILLLFRQRRSNHYNCFYRLKHRRQYLRLRYIKIDKWIDIAICMDRYDYIYG